MSAHSEGTVLQRTIDRQARILVLDPIDVECLAELSRKFTVAVHFGATPERLKELVRFADIVIVRSGVQLTNDIIESARNLRCIARAGSGVDNIDLEACRKRGITVFNIPGASASAVAELAMGLSIMLTRNIKQADRQVHEGVWRKVEQTGPGLRGRRMGIVGLGQIGSRVAVLAQAHGMSVTACVSHSTPVRTAAAALNGIEIKPMDDVLSNSDVICLAIPLNDQTRHLIDDSALQLMKRGTVIVNVSRGSILDEVATLQALESGLLSGLALDVHAVESSKSLFAGMENVILTPHLGAATTTAQHVIGQILLAELNEFLIGNEPSSRVA